MKLFKVEANTQIHLLSWIWRIFEMILKLIILLIFFLIVTTWFEKLTD